MCVNIAPLWDTSVGYTECNGTVWIETSNSRVAVVKSSTFDHLYYKLDEYTAAMKDDCIHYIEHSDYVELRNYMGQIKHVDYVTFYKNYDVEIAFGG